LTEVTRILSFCQGADSFEREREKEQEQVEKKRKEEDKDKEEKPKCYLFCPFNFLLLVLYLASFLSTQSDEARTKSLFRPLLLFSLKSDAVNALSLATLVDVDSASSWHLPGPQQLWWLAVAKKQTLLDAVATGSRPVVRLGSNLLVSDR
jgi:hypothetical protein